MNFDQFISTLEQYLSKAVTGNELLEVWRYSPEILQPIYFNLHHLVSDEDLAIKAHEYREMQLGEAHKLLEGLKQGKSLKNLYTINFLNRSHIE